MSLVHFHCQVKKNAGDTRRMININNNVATRLSDQIIEIQIFSIFQLWEVIRSPKFTLSEHVTKKYYCPVFFAIPLFGVWLSALFVAIICKIHKASYVIGETSTASRSMKLVRSLSPNTKLVVDVHGAYTEEREYLYPNISKKKLKKYWDWELYSFERADYVICQSEEMKRYIMENSSNDGSNIAVYKCGVDLSVFDLNAEKRINIRKELGYAADDIVFVYSGSTHKWQKLDAALKCFHTFHANYPKSKLMVLTREKDKLMSLISDNNLNDIIEVLYTTSLTLDQVGKYLNAADIAFLLRDNVVLNSVASPTKLAEYFACGLPIISSSVARKWVSGIGLDYLIYEDEEKDFLNAVIRLVNENDKKIIREYAASNLSIEQDNSNITLLFNL